MYHMNLSVDSRQIVANTLLSIDRLYLSMRARNPGLLSLLEILSVCPTAENAKLIHEYLDIMNDPEGYMCGGESDCECEFTGKTAHEIVASAFGKYQRIVSDTNRRM